ncbi:MAG: hypothetical protein PHN57_05995 [Candidatus Omnitrophica bacterium]|nr:hypothetical protein [Candidatus Omnitrophota bacterium]
MSKDKQKHEHDIVYALADYKQLVMAYKSKYSELIKKASFWRTTSIWLFCFLLSAGMIVVSEFGGIKKNMVESENNISRLGTRIETISDNLDKAQQELVAAKEELSKKDLVIKQLEQNMSNTSRELLEKLLQK